MQSIEKLESYFGLTVPELTQHITVSHQPLWGAMNAAKMLDHLSDALKLSMGVYVIPPESIAEKADKYKAITLTSDRPIPKGFDNPILKLLTKPNLVELEAAKVNLITNIALFKQTFAEQGPDFKTPHNIFGYLTYHEWLWFHYKHFSHHFAQFNLIPYIERFELN